MKKLILLLVTQLFFYPTNAQSGFENFYYPPKAHPDTMYFPFKDSLQLIVIDNYDTWSRQVAHKEATQPRGLSWSMVMGPAPKNLYFFRNKKGEIVKSFNGTIRDSRHLKNISFSNVNEFSFLGLEDIRELNNHLRFYNENDKMGLIDLQGNIVLQDEYDDIRRYQDRSERGKKLVIVKGELFGLVGENMKVLFPPTYKGYYPEHEQMYQGSIKVCDTIGKYGLINEQGEIQIELKYDAIQPIHDSMYVAYNFGPEKIPVGSGSYRNQYVCAVVFDKNYKVLSTLDSCDDIQYNGIKRFIFKKNKKYGVVDTQGKEIIPLIYDHISLEHGTYYVHLGNQAGLLGMDGKILIPIEYERNLYFYGKAIYVIKDGLIGVYSDKYKLIVSPQFKTKHWDMGKYILTRRDGSKGFVQHSGDETFYQSPEGEKISF